MPQALNYAGVAKLLHFWKQPPHTCVAGLLHSIYSTEMFPSVPTFSIFLAAYFDQPHQVAWF